MTSALITLAADGPHQIPEILHPEAITHTVVAVFLIVAGLVAAAIALRAGVRH
ncbi:MAG TPA: hypothetical protein VNF73_15275 [Candidatus Saccharimonadales bacterium]|nr:hypothetical protein [Candidatus Saccharimonadales bacterium]